MIKYKWVELFEKWPRAYKEFLKYLSIHNIKDFCFCDIEDFFDKYGIKIFFNYDYETGLIGYEIVYLMKNGLYDHFYSGCDFSFKEKAEATKQAFELLEKNLSEVKNDK